MPKAVGDLAARQQGDGVALAFTLPTRSTLEEALAEPPAVEIYRAFRAASSQGKLTTRLVYTIPGALVETYTADGQLRFLDPLRPEDVATHAGEQAVYMVRTRAAKRKASADSNIAAVRVFPTAEGIGDLHATVTESSIELAWSRPQRTSAGGAFTALAGYRVYRAEVEAGAEAAAAQDPSKAKLKAPLGLLGPAPAAAFRDTQFEFGRTYLYTVRSVAQYDQDSVESADSNAVVLTPRDTFPPAPPQGLVVLLVPATPDVPVHLELSWDISPETDLAGYNVYRSEQADERGERVNRDLLLAPSYRDMSVVTGRRYTFRVTAVDRAGNESQPGAPVSAEVTPAETAAK